MTARDLPILVTGGAGFIGCNLAEALLRQGRRVIVYDSLARPGVEANLAWLLDRWSDRVEPCVADIRDAESLTRAVWRSAAVFHLAAQVAVTTSLAAPKEDFEINVAATVALLEAVRAAPRPVPLLFASTNKVYGDLASEHWSTGASAVEPLDPTTARFGVSERRPLDFHTPYGCSKGAADQYVLDYARSYGLPAAVLRMSCIYGPRQLGTEDQGWVAHFMIRALSGETVTIYGDGRQVRDVLHVDDAVAAYLSALARIDLVRGRAFNLGGGPANAISLRQCLAFIEDLAGRPVSRRFEPSRAGDQRYFVADARAARAALGLREPRPWREGLRELASWLSRARGLPEPVLREAAL